MKGKKKNIVLVIRQGKQQKLIISPIIHSNKIITFLSILLYRVAARKPPGKNYLNNRQNSPAATGSGGYFSGHPVFYCK